MQKSASLRSLCLFLQSPQAFERQYIVQEAAVKEHDACQQAPKWNILGSCVTGRRSGRELTRFAYSVPADMLKRQPLYACKLWTQAVTALSANGFDTSTSAML